MSAVQPQQEALRPQVQNIRDIAATLDPAQGPIGQRQQRFEDLRQSLTNADHPMDQQMARVMASFAPGLFVGSDDPQLPRDNQDLERWFRQPKGHERRIHGRRHAGVRIVHEGPTLLPALDAHLSHPHLFEAQELLPYVQAVVPPEQHDAMRRRHIMRQARSRRTRDALLKSLEARCRDSS